MPKVKRKDMTMSFQEEIEELPLQCAQDPCFLETQYFSPSQEDQSQEQDVVMAEFGDIFKTGRERRIFYSEKESTAPYPTTEKRASSKFFPRKTKFVYEGKAPNPLIWSLRRSEIGEECYGFVGLLTQIERYLDRRIDETNLHLVDFSKLPSYLVPQRTRLWEKRREEAVTASWTAKILCMYELETLKIVCEKKKIDMFHSPENKIEAYEHMHRFMASCKPIARQVSKKEDESNAPDPNIELESLAICLGIMGEDLWKTYGEYQKKVTSAYEAAAGLERERVLEQNSRDWAMAWGEHHELNAIATILAEDQSVLKGKRLLETGIWRGYITKQVKKKRVKTKDGKQKSVSTEKTVFVRASSYRKSANEETDMAWMSEDEIFERARTGYVGEEKKFVDVPLYASPDFIVLDDNEVPCAGGEVKCRYPFFLSKKDWLYHYNSFSAPFDKIPFYYVPQIMTQMLVTGLRKWYFISWSARKGTRIFLIKWTKRHKRYASLMITFIRRSYKDYVLKGRPPPDDVWIKSKYEKEYREMLSLQTYIIDSAKIVSDIPDSFTQKAPFGNDCPRKDMFIN